MGRRVFQLASTSYKRLCYADFQHTEHFNISWFLLCFCNFDEQITDRITVIYPL